ncbi:chromosome partitioning protein [Rhizobium sp. AN5]|uniref:ParA family protein n=1 Tax=Rhizobium sp. AN5 TaxID=1855304 RepID=UPI000BDBEB8F|nr:ParA family protein [Rhizobium sp. AN5]SOC90022.1 chromosome partitioning protein [Rhizobium sp. AN5]
MADLIIACLSQKGGVGKSTLAHLIARTYAVAGWSVMIADFNLTQLTSVKWSRTREKSGIEPKVPAEAYHMPSALPREDSNLVVADGRPDSDQTSLDIARLADAIVLPTGLSIFDLEPSLAFAKELVAKGVNRDKIIFVLSKVTDSKLAVSEAREYLSEFRVAHQTLELKHSYMKCQNHGYALSEVHGLNTARLEEIADLVAAEIVDVVSKSQEAA